jgi:choline dehydrogenase-like flavoprotein
MNAMIYIRGNRADYDEGATGWSYDELLPYFIKSEANERGARQFHGAKGSLFVQVGRSQHPLIDRIIEGFGVFDDRKRPSKREPSLTVSRSRSRLTSRARD